jgi:hypothetical protein
MQKDKMKGKKTASNQVVEQLYLRNYLNNLTIKNEGDIKYFIKEILYGKA